MPEQTSKFETERIGTRNSQLRLWPTGDDGVTARMVRPSSGWGKGSILRGGKAV